MTYNVTNSLSKFRLSRRGRKLQISDDPRTIIAMPKDIPERTWVEILQKEETDLLIFDIREEIVEAALNICYKDYMAKQNLAFTVHCAAQAWLKLINWHFYRHDPGEEPNSYPPCYIPRRMESWTPDEIPAPSPKDTWTMHELTVGETCSEEKLQKWPSSSSLEYSEVEEIPRQYWFPGKVELPGLSRYKFDVEGYEDFEASATVQSRSEDTAATESEVVQKVTDYAAEEMSKVSTASGVKIATPTKVDEAQQFTSGSLQGAGDSSVVSHKAKSQSKTFSRVGSRTSKMLPPIDSGSRSSTKSHMSLISDCRLRNLRLDTQYEISPEKVDTPPAQIVKRK